MRATRARATGSGSADPPIRCDSDQTNDQTAADDQQPGHPGEAAYSLVKRAVEEVGEPRLCAPRFASHRVGEGIGGYHPTGRQLEVAGPNMPQKRVVTDRS